MTTAVPGADLTVGYIARHAPNNAAMGRAAALIDIAQDFLLWHLHHSGALDHVTFKGGTALRKLYAGGSGRFSTDLDFAVAAIDDDRDAVTALLVDEIRNLRIGPFAYGIDLRRDHYFVTYETSLGQISSNLTSKIDVGPPPWLPPVRRSWVPLDLHRRYGIDLPELSVIQLEENMAEKIARLCRRTFARDVYDLVWISKTTPHNRFAAIWYADWPCSRPGSTATACPRQETPGPRCHPPRSTTPTGGDALDRPASSTMSR